MLILFHCTCLIANKLFEKINKHFELKKREQFIKEIRERKFKFSPAAFRQRYLEVYYILTDERWRCKISTLCDFGCGEMGFYHQMRSFPLTSFSLIDIDEETLRKYASHLVPCPYENIDRIRHDPFVVSVYVGSVADPSYHFKSVHVITAIELVEHLYPDCLEAFPYTIFGFYTPLIVIVTTPNADFNVLFFDHPEILRHYDHKFEWTREQFEDWSNNIVTRFPDYTVFFSGAGNGPSGTEFLGKCTQIGIFVRRDVLEGDYTIEANRNRCDSSHIHSSTCKCTCTACNIYSFGICTYYSKSTIPPIYNNNNKEHFKQIFEKPFPYTQDFRPLEEKMFVEFRQKLLSISKLHYNERRNKCIVPVYNIKSGYYGDSVREEDIVRILKKNGYEIEESIEYTEYYVVLDPMEESEDSSSDVWEEEEQQKFPFWYEHHGSGFIDVNRVESEAEKEESDQIKPDTQSKVPNMAEESKMNPQDFENNNGFPDWLLNILGNQVGIEEALPINELDEAHFYCQGDGLGVHPSILAVEVDGDEEDDEESSDSTNNTEDFAEVDPLISSHDVSSLQEDVTDTQVVSEDTTQSTNIVTTNQQQSSDVESTSNLSDSGI